MSREEVNAPKVSVAMMIGHFRPQRSAISPEIMAEIINPRSAAPKTGPKALKGIRSVLAMDGANPRLWASNPSRTRLPHKG